MGCAFDRVGACVEVVKGMEDSFAFDRIGTGGAPAGDYPVQLPPLGNRDVRLHGKQST